MESPATHSLHLASIDETLEVWSGQVDLVIPLYPVGELCQRMSPLDAPDIDVTVNVTFQACNETECLLPQTRKLKLTIPLDVVDVPNLAIHTGHGQREGNYDSTPAMKRLVRRKTREPSPPSSIFMATNENAPAAQALSFPMIERSRCY